MGAAQSDVRNYGAEEGFPLLNGDELAYLDSIGTPLGPRPPGHVFFQEGEETDEVLLIKSGHVKVVAGKPGHIAAIRKPGDIIGEMAFLRRKPRSASLIAYDEVHVLRISGQSWLNFLYKFPRAMHAQLVAADERLDQATKKFVSSDSAVERKLAQVLIELLSLNLGERVGDRYVLRFSQRDLASLTAASLDAVKKIIRRLREAKILDTGRQTVEIWNQQVLEEIASGNETAIA
ncbi:Crp/Fnr family transcriptional regulator [Actinosynnema sp. CS-041913]|uniref:Crp/Fnr family transcriptional regulator n=1 Tax=Actinosynnema sp. CS-041913 TaxID=3239917 RepID=UPI003D8D7758